MYNFKVFSRQFSDNFRNAVLNSKLLGVFIVLIELCLLIYNTADATFSDSTFVLPSVLLMVGLILGFAFAYLRTCAQLLGIQHTCILVQKPVSTTIKYIVIFSLALSIIYLILVEPISLIDKVKQVIGMPMFTVLMVLGLMMFFSVSFISATLLCALAPLFLQQSFWISFKGFLRFLKQHHFKPVFYTAIFSGGMLFRGFKVESVVLRLFADSIVAWVQILIMLSLGVTIYQWFATANKPVK